MLYKKIHRQYVREWRIGRKFWYHYKVRKVTFKPEVCEYFIRMDNFILIDTCGPRLGQIQKKDITWLD